MFYFYGFFIVLLFIEIEFNSIIWFGESLDFLLVVGLHIKLAFVDTREDLVT